MTKSPGTKRSNKSPQKLIKLLDKIETKIGHSSGECFHEVLRFHFYMTRNPTLSPQKAGQQKSNFVDWCFGGQKVIVIGRINLAAAKAEAGS